MTYCEIESSVLEAKSGNEDELLKVLEQYKPFIIKTAKQFNIKNYDIHDKLQIRNIALINAVTKYKIGSHTFSSYAYTAIKNAFKYTAKQNSKFNDKLSLNIHVANGDTEFLSCFKSFENIEDEIIKSEKIVEVKRAVSKLSTEEMYITIEVPSENMLQKQVLTTFMLCEKGIKY